MYQPQVETSGWKFDPPDVQIGIWRGYIQRSGLFPLVDSFYPTVSRVVISTFVKRWYPEINTFHLPFGKMTITLNYVSTLISISMVGNSVSSNLQGCDVHKLVARTLRVTKAEAAQEVQGRSLKLEWLWTKF